MHCEAVNSNTIYHIKYGTQCRKMMKNNTSKYDQFWIFWAHCTKLYWNITRGQSRPKMVEYYRLNMYLATYTCKFLEKLLFDSESTMLTLICHYHSFSYGLKSCLTTFNWTFIFLWVFSILRSKIYLLVFTVGRAAKSFTTLSRTFVAFVCPIRCRLLSLNLQSNSVFHCNQDEWYIIKYCIFVVQNKQFGYWKCAKHSIAANKIK